MTDAPASPKANRLATPGWLDKRLVLGVLLVLTAVLAGARVLSSADRSQLVWATTRDLAPGTQLAAGDLTRVRVRLFGNGTKYVRGDGPPPIGHVVRRGVGKGELLPFFALADGTDDASFRFVTVPVSRGHLPPDLRSGTQVDVYVSPEAKAGSTTTSAAAGPPRLVLRNVTVRLRRAVGGLVGGNDQEPIVLRVRPADVAALLAAVSEGRIDLVGVPRAQETEPSPAGTG